MAPGDAGRRLAGRASVPVRVRRLIDREHLVPDDARVLVALSGGGDSVALTLLLGELAATSPWTLAGVLHLNHQLRPTADDDERFCRELAERLSLPIAVERADVRALATAERISIEEAGHRARYACFERVRESQDVDLVATAHTRDDQAETYLMRVIRGAGPDGLAGIRPRSGAVIRPLLDVGRAELRAYLVDRGVAFREDESNQDRRVTRNRVRHDLIPLLQERFSPGIVDALARGAAIARADAEWLQTAAAAVRGSIAETRADGDVTIRSSALCRQPIALARRVARGVLETVGGRMPGFDDVERLLALARAPGEATSLDMPGCRVAFRAGVLHVTKSRRRPGVPGGTPYAHELPVPGEVRVGEARLVISAARLRSPSDHGGRLVARGLEVAVAAADLTLPLTVRSWRPGDVVRPLGLGGHKKLQDLFVDRKVPRSERQTVPIVADAGEAIVWVVGHTVAEDFRVTPDTEGMLLLTARHLEGAG